MAASPTRRVIPKKANPTSHRSMTATHRARVPHDYLLITERGPGSRSGSSIFLAQAGFYVSGNPVGGVVQQPHPRNRSSLPTTTPSRLPPLVLKARICAEPGRLGGVGEDVGPLSYRRNPAPTARHEECRRMNPTAVTPSARSAPGAGLAWPTLIGCQSMRRRCAGAGPRSRRHHLPTNWTHGVRRPSTQSTLAMSVEAGARTATGTGG